MKRASLEQMRAQVAAMKAACEATLATFDAMLRDDDQASPAADVVNLETHARLVGCAPRKAREFFARAEREGFAVSRVGRGLFMARAEWTRAVDALSPKRKTPPPTEPLNADALLDAVGAIPVANRAPRARR